MSILDKIISWGNNKHQSSSSIWTKLVLSIVSILAIVGLFYFLHRKSKEFAKALHERDKLVEEKEQAKTDLEVTKLQDERTKLIFKIVGLDKRIVDKQNELDQAAVEYHTLRDQIGQVETWQDVDRIIRW